MSVDRPYIRSAVAMRVAQCDRQKFNEAVSAEFLPCAPRVDGGSVRLFSNDDLLMLFIFARLLELGLPPRSAGRYACYFSRELRDREGNLVKVMTYVRGTQGEFFSSVYDRDLYYHGVGMVTFTVEFPIERIWTDIIKPKLDFERSLLGTEGVDD